MTVHVCIAGAGYLLQEAGAHDAKSKESADVNSSAMGVLQGCQASCCPHCVAWLWHCPTCSHLAHTVA
jgi:hypothetical protein